MSTKTDLERFLARAKNTLPTVGRAHRWQLVHSAASFVSISFVYMLFFSFHRKSLPFYLFVAVISRYCILLPRNRYLSIRKHFLFLFIFVGWIFRYWLAALVCCLGRDWPALRERHSSAYTRRKNNLII